MKKSTQEERLLMQELKNDITGGNPHNTVTFLEPEHKVKYCQTRMIQAEIQRKN